MPNPKGINEVGSSSNSGMDEVKAIITLRSGKEVDQPMPKPVEETRKEVELEPEHILLKEDSMKHSMPPPFPQARKVEELEGKQLHEVQEVNENLAQSNPYTNFQSPVHPAEQCPMAPSVKDLMSEYAHAVGLYKPPQPNTPYGNTYNSNWRNNPNLSWKPTPPAYVSPRCQTTVCFPISTTTTTILLFSGTSHFKFE